MRHQCRVPQLGRPADQRKAMLRGLTTQLIREGRVTTQGPCQSSRDETERMISLAKDGSLAARRRAWATSTTSSWCTPCLTKPASDTATATVVTPASFAPCPAAVTTPKWPSSSWSELEPLTGQRIALCLQYDGGPFVAGSGSPSTQCSADPR